MHVNEADEGHLKQWIIKKLEDISDADSDVLADYVLALVKTEDTEDNVRANSLGQLEDFLQDNTGSFVDDLLTTIRTGSFRPGNAPPPAADSKTAPTGPSFNPPSGPAAQNRRTSIPGLGDAPMNGGGDPPANGFGSRKRRHERDTSFDGRDPHYSNRNGGERQIKQMRRGGGRGDFGGGRGDHGHGYGRGNAPGMQAQSGGFNGNNGMANLAQLVQQQQQQPQGIPNISSPQPGAFPMLDPNNPLAALLAMQAMGFPALPGFPPFPGAGSPPVPQHMGQQPQRKTGQPCRDYETKGFCALGTSCPYEHGVDRIMIPQADEYDPKNSSIDFTQSTPRRASFPERTDGGDSGGRGDRGGRGGRRGDFQGGRRGDHRAAFSSAAPNFDRSNTTIVVESIPEENFSEEAVRAFFEQFGEVVEVTMQPYKRLALVKYSDWGSAKQAYDSPKVIFDNRFVKVYWYKPDREKDGANGTARGQNQGDTAMGGQEEEVIDPAEVAKKQAEAQRVHEEKMKKLKEAEQAKKELAEKVKQQQAERQKLLERLAAKTKAASSTSGSPAPDAEAANGNGTAVSPSPAEDKKAAATEALKKKLAELEAEAQSMGISTEDDPYASGYGRGRGGYRGRGTFVPRGRGGYDPSFRGGSYRGWGAFRGRGGATGAVKRLDNRPKKIAVKGVETGSEADEALRQYLFHTFELGDQVESVEPHPENKSVQVVSFKERYVAETFLNHSPSLPNIGRLDLTWYTPTPGTSPLTPSTTSTSTPATFPSSTSISTTAKSLSATAPSFVPSSDADMGMGDSANGSNGDASMGKGEMDYDVADEEDPWLARGIS